MTPCPVASWPLPRCLVPSPPPAPRRGGAGDKLGAEVLGGRQTTSVGAEGRERSVGVGPAVQTQIKAWGRKQSAERKNKMCQSLTNENLRRGKKVSSDSIIHGFNKCGL